MIFPLLRPIVSDSRTIFCYSLSILIRDDLHISVECDDILRSPGELHLTIDKDHIVIPFDPSPVFVNYPQKIHNIGSMRVEIPEPNVFGIPRHTMCCCNMCVSKRDNNISTNPFGIPIGGRISLSNAVATKANFTVWECIERPIDISDHIIERIASLSMESQLCQ